LVDKTYNKFRSLVLRVLPLIIYLFSGTVALQAQQPCGNTSLEEALKAYQNGNFERVEQLISTCLTTGYTIEQKIQAYKLLALTYLALDKRSEAEGAIDHIFRLNPDFSTTPFDPQKFAYLVNSRKTFTANLVTASRQAEPLNEAPVPVFVITEQMIEAIGAKTLKDVLTVYVPGITDITDHNEVNISMHGVYASSQQKILIMLNGHRLNSRAYSSANPDYSISLEEVRQIEILRGPASSLYGNVALTSVINIITKSGKDIQGSEIKAGLGNYGQQFYSFLHGSGFANNQDLLIWGQFYQAKGEVIEIDSRNDHSPHPKQGQAIIEGFDNKPSYDVGMVFNGRNFSLMGNLGYCKPIDPFTAGGITGEVYDYDKYRTLMGTGPGLGSSSGHIDFKYNREIGGDQFLFNPYFDVNSVNAGLVINPSIEQFGIVNWNEYSAGSVIQYRKGYQLARLGSGNIIAGGQADHMKVYDSFYLLGLNGEFTNIADSSSAKILDPGSETILSGFLQIKHRVNNKLILNIGGRYDNKFRHLGENVSNFSPRLSAIYLPNPAYSFKVSFAQSFVDAPYWYRYNRLASYKGSENLQPEHLSAIQLTSSFNLLENKLDIEVNFFYNSLTDFIYRDPEATGNEPRYRNAGRLQLSGMENTVYYTTRGFNIRANLTYMYVIDAKDYAVTGSAVNNVPSLSSTLIANLNPFARKSDKNWFNITLKYAGKQKAPFYTYVSDSKIYYPNNEQKGIILVNTTLKSKQIRNFLISLTVNNVFDQEYYQGGSVEFPYPKPGRWYMMGIQYRIAN